PCATAAGAHEPHAQRYRGHEGDRRSAYDQIPTGPGRPSADFGERHRSGAADREGRPDLQCLLYHQAAGLWHGAGDQPFHRRVAWRPSMGNTQRRTGRYVSFHLADRSPGRATAPHRNGIPGVIRGEISFTITIKERRWEAVDHIRR